MSLSGPEASDANPRPARRPARLKAQETRGRHAGDKREDRQREADRVRRPRRGDPGGNPRMGVDGQRQGQDSCLCLSLSGFDGERRPARARMNFVSKRLVGLGPRCVNLARLG